MKPFLHSFHRLGVHNDKQSYALTIIRHEVAYDIEMFTYTVAKTHFAEVSNKDKKEVILTSTQDDWLDRQIQTAISNIKSTIRFAIPRNSRMVSDSILVSPQDYLIPVFFENEWCEDPQTLTDAVHDYIVRYAIAQWALAALPDRYSILTANAEDALHNIHDIACTYNVQTVTPFI